MFGNFRSNRHTFKDTARVVECSVTEIVKIVIFVVGYKPDSVRPFLIQYSAFFTCLCYSCKQFFYCSPVTITLEQLDPHNTMRVEVDGVIMSDGNKALIVVDMLNDFVHPKGSLFCGESSRTIIPRIAKIVDEFRAARNTIIYLQDAHNENDLEFRLFPNHAVRGSWGSEIVEELQPAYGDIVVSKTRFSGFFRTDLEKILKEKKTSEVWVVGVCTSICVMDTVADLKNRDYEVVVPRDGVADFDLEMHDCALKRMERVYRAKLLTE